MLRKLIYLLPFFVVVSAVAAPSTGLIGKNKASNVNVAKTVAITPKSQPTIKSTNTKVIQSLGTSSDSSARLPALSKIKQPNKIPVANQNTSTNTNTNTNTSTTAAGVSQSTFNSLVQRVEALESKKTNAITDVVESGSGTYVNGVTKQDNKLNVEKTHLLRAPIKNASGTTLSGNAEIWIVK